MCVYIYIYIYTPLTCFPCYFFTCPVVAKIMHLPITYQSTCLLSHSFIYLLALAHCNISSQAVATGNQHIAKTPPCGGHVEVPFFGMEQNTFVQTIKTQFLNKVIKAKQTLILVSVSEECSKEQKMAQPRLLRFLSDKPYRGKHGSGHMQQ